MARHLLLAALALAFQGGTLLVPREVESQAALATHRLGYPIAFVSQDLSGLDPPEFPRRYRLVSPWEHPARLLPARAFAAFACLLAALEFASAAARRGFRSLGTRRRRAR